MLNQNVERLENKQAVAQRAAELFCELAANAAADGKFSVALAGGSTPRQMYELLAAEPWRSKLPWDNIQWFIGDERYVPSEHRDSNFRMARESLFTPANVSENNIFRVRTELSPDAAAKDYAATVREKVSINEAGVGLEIPVFDVVLLGMGDDGHTASLFPYTSALDETHEPVVANYVEKLNTWRITVTRPVILAARNVIMLVTGTEKAAALAQVLNGDLDEKKYPAQLLRESAHTTWLIDEAAAQRL